MKRSRKGTRLNELQYFRQPPPHARKKMTCLRIFPSENASPTSKSRLIPSKTTTTTTTTTTTKKKKRKKNNPPTKLDINQPSIEMAVITYSESQVSLFRQTRETQVSELEFPEPPDARRDVSSFTQTDRPKEKEASTSVRLQQLGDQRERSAVAEPADKDKSRRQSVWLKRIFADFFQLFLPGKRGCSEESSYPEPKPLKRDPYESRNCGVGLASLFRSKNEEEAASAAVRQRILIKGDESLRIAYMKSVALRARSAENGRRLHAQMSCAAPLKSF